MTVTVVVSPEVGRMKVLHQHADDCWSGDMVLIGRRLGDNNWQTHEWRDKNGNATGRTTMWHIATCNDPNCPAEMLVQLGPLIDELATVAYPVTVKS